MNRRNRGLFSFSRLGILVLMAAIVPLACSQPSPPPPAAPPPAVSEGEIVRQGTAACSRLAADRGLTVLEVRRFARTGEDKWDTRLVVRPQSGGLEYEMGCRYNYQGNKASLYRP